LKLLKRRIIDWLEVIEIRAVGTNREMLKLKLQDIINELSRESKLLTVKVYRHAALDTDFSVHIYHNSKKTDTKCSSICTLLISMLKDFGIVNHTVWIEQENPVK
jgi:hypothetical protein